MGFVSGLLGGQNKFRAQGVTDFDMPATTGQANTAYDQTQNGINQQQAFVNALGAQNGLGNQSQVYNQLQGVANGTGPNPAQAQLAQATGANTANQAALMASQRGTGANAGLLARQAAMQGGANQQNAAGQAATLQAQQSLNALGQAGAMANQQAGQQAQGLQTLNQAAQGQQSNILNAIGQQNNAKVANQSNLNNVNAGVTNQNSGNAQSAGSGLLSGIGSAFGLAHGGAVPEPFHWASHVAGNYAYGGVTAPGAAQAEQTHLAGPTDMSASSKELGDTLGSAGKKLMTKVPMTGTPMATTAGGPMDSTGAPAPAIPGMDPSQVLIAKSGALVPGKAKVKGDNLKNDTVPAVLSPGEVVIPRSVMNSKDPAAASAKFVAAILAKQGMKKKS